MSNTHRINHIGGLIEALPSLFGFMPVESVVVLTTHGERNKMGFRLRFDLADFTTRPQEAAEMIAGHVTRQAKPDGSVIVLVVTETGNVGQGVIDQIVDTLDGPILAGGVAHGGIVTEWLTGETYEYTDPCTSVASTMAVAEGQSIMHTRDDVESSLTPQHTAAAAGDGPTDAHLGLAALNGRFTMTEQARIALVRSAANTPTRDDLMTSAETGDTTQHATVWTQVARTAHRDEAGPVYAMAGYCTYLGGDGARALILLETALKLDPDHTLARLILTAVEAGINPELMRTATS